MRHVIIAAAYALTLAACVTPTRYAPAARPGDLGFSERPIESDRWRVSFRAGSGASPALAEDYALRRAAELTLERGYGWFRVTNRFVEATSPTSPRFSVGGGSTSFSGRRRSGFGVGVGAGLGFGGEPAPAATLEVIFGRGPAPQEPDVYDAAEVVRSIAPAV